MKKTIKLIRDALLWLPGKLFLYYVMLPLVCAMWELNDSGNETTY